MLVKRTFDLAVALMLAPLLLPVSVVVAVAIKLDSPGPVFFCQRRAGRNGRPFLMFKFRTMVCGAEKTQRYPTREELSRFVFQQDDDPRVTRVGRLLRATSLDELPQLLNVLIGDMSFVGPRPEVFPIVELYTDEERRRLAVLPGITGLAQVSGRSNLSTGETIRLDNEYVERQSFRLDLWILWRTVAVVFLREGAV